MGNICDQPLNQEYQSKYNNSNAPHPLYAKQCKQTPNLPIDESILASVHHQPLIVPGWYCSKHSQKIQQYYLILHFDLYYRGQWRKGVPHGLGEVITKDGQYFKGYFSQGVAQGPECLFVKSKYCYYLGMIYRNQRSGKGKFIDGEYCYQGYWLNNLPHGQGVETYANGDTYQGGFHQGIKRGQGIYTWKQGHFESYSGYFRGDQLHGKGKLKIRDGSTWQGVFDCQEQLSIKKSQCIAEDQIFKGEIFDGNPVEIFTVMDSNNTYKLKMQNGKITGSNEQKQQQVIFRNKIIRYYDPKADQDTLEKIITEVQSGYKTVRKHSEALQKIKKALPNFRCGFWREGEEVSGLVIVHICGKHIRVADDSSDSPAP